MATRHPISVLVTVNDTEHKLDDVAFALQKAGLSQIEVMRFSGIIGGTVSGDDLARLEAVPGVEQVELPPTMHAC